jgi:hypothetical protein
LISTAPLYATHGNTGWYYTELTDYERAEDFTNNILVGRPEGRRPLGRPRRRWEDNIKMVLREIWFGDVDWIHWAQERDRWRALVNMVMNLRVP